MRRSGAVLVLSLGLGAAAMPSADAGLFSRGPDTSIAGMLQLVPAESWGPETGGFYALDLAAMRDGLGLDWPEHWPAAMDDDDRRQIVGLTAKLALQPFALYMLAVAEPDTDPLARIGLSILHLGGTLDIGFFTPDTTASYLFGEDLVDEAAVSDALEAQPSVRAGLSVWPDEAAIDLPYWDGNRLVADGSDTAIVQNTDRDVESLLAGESSLADLPAISTLLAAVDGPEHEAGALVALWAAHRHMLSRLPRFPEGGWPEDAALPQFDLFAAALRYDDDAAVGTLVLVYNDMVDAELAEMELTRRLPEIASRFPVENLRTSIVAGEGAWRAVVIESRDAVSADNRRQSGMFLAASMQFLLLDFSMILPQR